MRRFTSLKIIYLLLLQWPVSRMPRVVSMVTALVTSTKLR